MMPVKEPVQPSHRFLRACAVCWVVTGFTTLGLIFLPRMLPPAPDVISQVMRSRDPIYQARMWIGVLHPFIAVVAALGVALVRSRESLGSAVCGFLFFAFWAVGEAIQQSLILVALNWGWRAAYLTTSDPATQASLARSMSDFEQLSDGIFFFILFSFVCANLLYARATWTEQRWDRVVSVFFVLAAGLGVVSFATSFGAGILPASVMAFLYPAIQPAGRCLTGIWLWKQAR
jgi:hypothetical protein